MAVGAPWLGASKTVRGLVTGEKFGMDAFLNTNEALTFSHRIGTSTYTDIRSVISLPNLSAFLAPQPRRPSCCPWVWRTNITSCPRT
jgi:hypothetical protein